MEKFSNIIDIMDACVLKSWILKSHGVTFWEFFPRGGMTTRLIEEVGKARRLGTSGRWVAFISGEMTYLELERRFDAAGFYARGNGIELYGVDRKFDPRSGQYDLIVIDRPDLIFDTHTDDLVMCVSEALKEHIAWGTEVICGVLKPRP